MKRLKKNMIKKIEKNNVRSCGAVSKWSKKKKGKKKRINGSKWNSNQNERKKIKIR